MSHLEMVSFCCMIFQLGTINHYQSNKNCGKSAIVRCNPPITVFIRNSVNSELGVALEAPNLS